MMRELDQFAKVPRRAGAAATFAVGGMRRAGARLKHEPSLFKHHVTFTRAGPAGDGPGRGSQGRLNHIAANMHHLAIDACATRPVDLPCRGQEHLDPEILKDTKGRRVHACDLFGLEEVHDRERVAQVPVIQTAFRPGFGRGRGPTRSPRHQPRIALPSGS